MEYHLLPLLVAGGFAAGFINVLAGGGSMLTLPLLIIVGLPATVANGTNRIAILIQNVSGVLGFRSKGVHPWKGGLRLCLPTCLGAAAGAFMATRVDDAVLERIFGAVLAVMCGVILLKPDRLIKGRASADAVPGLSLKTFAIFFAVGLWGGFAQVGVGFLFLGGLMLCSDLDLVYANAVKILVILAFTILSLLIFFAGSQVALLPGLVMAAGNAAGAWTASVMSVKKGAPWVRTFLIGAALLAALKLLGVLDAAWNLIAG